MGIQPVAIALVGDYDAGITAHAAIEKSLQLASAAPAAAKVAWRWLSTPELAASVQELIQHDAVCCVPGSPNPERGRRRWLEYKQREPETFRSWAPAAVVSTRFWSTPETCWESVKRHTRKKPRTHRSP